jgi:colicin import membrane protein
VIPDAINRNWAFSEHMTHRRFNLEAILVIRIQSSGHISDVWFEKKSGDKYFDDSAYKAVIKSNPLPSLPSGHGTYKVGLRFTPSGMK